MSTLAIPEPDMSVVERREAIVQALREIVPEPDGVIADEDGRRAFETDALTAYRQMPLAAVLPTTTEQVAAVMKYCHDNKIKVVARGAGTSLCGGAMPLRDSIVLGVSKMNRVLEVNYRNRTARLQTGITNLG
ncbi:MAG: FAD-binding protein, partial [Alphaproteobacteria bacterium]